MRFTPFISNTGASSAGPSRLVHSIGRLPSGEVQVRAMSLPDSYGPESGLTVMTGSGGPRMRSICGIVVVVVAVVAVVVVIIVITIIMKSTKVLTLSSVCKQIYCNC